MWQGNKIYVCFSLVYELFIGLGWNHYALLFDTPHNSLAGLLAKNHLAIFLHTLTRWTFKVEDVTVEAICGTLVHLVDGLQVDCLIRHLHFWTWELAFMTPSRRFLWSQHALNRSYRLLLSLFLMMSSRSCSLLVFAMVVELDALFGRGQWLLIRWAPLLE